MKTVGAFEKKFRRCERISIAIMKDGKDKRTDANLDADYPFERAAPEDWTIAELQRNRVAKILPGHDFKFYDASGHELHGKTLLKNARSSARR